MTVKNSIDSNKAIFTLSIVSDLSGIPVHSIRQYVDKGLIIPYKKESGRNLFSQVDVFRLKYIHKLLKRRWVEYSWHKSCFCYDTLLGSKEML